ncbi:hypothetical protein [Micromonospora radicis]|uniref:hypothetical protein n=1 Tax=Micromonospora radicis TaxID=1894971 RepID=UPI0011C3F4D0|nr:hypothetical protein [Micromonospora radicis]
MDDEDEYDEDMPPLWVRRPDAKRAEFHAERDRLTALITSRLATPEIVVTGAYDTYRAVWRRGDRALLLETTDDIHVLALRCARHPASTLRSVVHRSGQLSGAAAGAGLRRGRGRSMRLILVSPCHPEELLSARSSPIRATDAAFAEFRGPMTWRATTMTEEVEHAR